MKLVLYYAAHRTPEVYERCWEEFLERAHKLKYHVIQLTSLDEKVTYGDEVIRYDIDPSMIVYSREICYSKFLSAARPDDQFAFVEPDSFVLKKIPDVPEGVDLVLLTRHYQESNIPPGIRIARGRAAPFFRLWLKLCEVGSWDTDVKALVDIFGDHGSIKPGHKRRVAGVNILFECANPYGVDAMEEGIYMVQFKGNGKLNKMRIYTDQLA